MKYGSLHLVVAGLLGAFFLLGECTAEEIRLVGGEKLQGKIVAVADGGLTIETAGKASALGLSDVEEVLFPVSKTAQRDTDSVKLRDGGPLSGRVSFVRGEELSVGTTAFGDVRVSLDAVEEIVFAGAEGGAAQGVSGDTAHDRVWLRGGNKLPEGLVKGFEEGHMLYACSLGENLSVPVEKIARIVLRSPGAPKAKPGGIYFAVETLDGCRVTASRMVCAKGVWELQEGPLTLRTHTDQLKQIRVVGGRVVYISDLVPTRTVTHGYFDEKWPVWWRADRSWGGNPLSLRGRTFAKGIGCHPYCELHYALDGKHSKFVCTVGVDDEARGDGSAVFKVLVDGAQKFASGRVTGRSAPVEVSVPVNGARELCLVADFADGSPVLARADWADGRLIREKSAPESP